MLRRTRFPRWHARTGGIAHRRSSRSALHPEMGGDSIRDGAAPGELGEPIPYPDPIPATNANQRPLSLRHRNHAVLARAVAVSAAPGEITVRWLVAGMPCDDHRMITEALVVAGERGGVPTPGGRSSATGCRKWRSSASTTAGRHPDSGSGGPARSRTLVSSPQGRRVTLAGAVGHPRGCGGLLASDRDEPSLTTAMPGIGEMPETQRPR